MSSDLVSYAIAHPEDMQAQRRAIRVLRKAGTKRNDLSRILFPGAIYCYYAGCDKPLLVTYFIERVDQALILPSEKYKLKNIEGGLTHLQFISTHGSPLFKMMGLRDSLQSMWSFGMKVQGKTYEMYLKLLTVSTPEQPGYNWTLHLGSADVVLETEEVSVTLDLVGGTLVQMLQSYAAAVVDYDD